MTAQKHRTRYLGITFARDLPLVARSFHLLLLKMSRVSSQESVGRREETVMYPIKVTEQKNKIHQEKRVKPDIRYKYRRQSRDSYLFKPCSQRLGCRCNNNSSQHNKNNISNIEEKCKKEHDKCRTKHRSGAYTHRVFRRKRHICIIPPFSDYSNSAKYARFSLSP